MILKSYLCLYDHEMLNHTPESLTLFRFLSISERQRKASQLQIAGIHNRNKPSYSFTFKN